MSMTLVYIICSILLFVVVTLLVLVTLHEKNKYRIKEKDTDTDTDTDKLEKKDTINSYVTLKDRIKITTNERADGSISISAEETEIFKETLQDCTNIKELMIYTRGFLDTFSYKCAFFVNSDPKVSLTEAFAVQQFLIAILTRTYELSKKEEVK